MCPIMVSVDQQDLRDFQMKVTALDLKIYIFDQRKGVFHHEDRAKVEEHQNFFSRNSPNLSHIFKLIILCFFPRWKLIYLKGSIMLFIKSPMFIDRQIMIVKLIKYIIRCFDSSWKNRSVNFIKLEMWIFY